MKLNKMNRMRKISLCLMIPFSLIFTSSMVLYTSWGKTSNSPPPTPEPEPVIHHILDPSKSDWSRFYEGATSGDFAPGTNGNFASGWQGWLEDTNYDTLDLGAFSSIAGNAFFKDSTALLVGDMPIRYFIFSSNTCTSIGMNAFLNCSSLTSVDLGSVTSIGDYAFLNCSSLTSVRFPNCLTYFGNSPFQGCSSLTSIDLSNCTSLTSITEGTFYNCTSLASLALPNSLTSIGDWGFKNCSLLRSLTLPNSLISIGNSAFADCSSITSIVASYSTIPNNWKTNIFSGWNNNGTVIYTGSLDASVFLTYLKNKGLPDGWHLPTP